MDNTTITKTIERITDDWWNVLNNFLYKGLKFIMLLSIFIVLIAIISYWLGIWETKYDKWVKANINATKHFKGYYYPKSEHEYIEEGITNFPEEKLHFIVYGKTGSGKTTFIKKYIDHNYKDRNNVYIFCKGVDEWNTEFNHVYGTEQWNLLSDMDSFKGTIDKPNLLILDDMSGHINQLNVGDIFTKGRHINVQIVVLAHKACDVDNKIRCNIDVFYVTTINNSVFFEELKKNYSLQFKLDKYVWVDYGIIRIDTIRNEYIVYDKNMNMIHNSSEQITKLPRNFDISKYLKQKVLSETDIENIIIFLEGESKDPIFIIPETFDFYYNKYITDILKLRIPPIQSGNTTMENIKKHCENFNKNSGTFIKVGNNIKKFFNEFGS